MICWVEGRLKFQFACQYDELCEKYGTKMKKKKKKKMERNGCEQQQRISGMETSATKITGNILGYLCWQNNTSPKPYYGAHKKTATKE